MRDHSATGTENGPPPEDIVTSDGTRPAVQSNAVQTNPAQFNAAPPSDRLPTSVASSPADGPAPEHYLKTELYRLLQQDAESSSSCRRALSTAFGTGTWSTPNTSGSASVSR